jgi:hypothetical protein
VAGIIEHQLRVRKSMPLLPFVIAERQQWRLPGRYLDRRSDAPGGCGGKPHDLPGSGDLLRQPLEIAAAGGEHETDENHHGSSRFFSVPIGLLS